MNIFIKATKAKKPRTSESQKIAYAYAAILIIFALTQLFTFDKFLILVESFGLPGGDIVARLFVSTIVTSEVLALPFLLGLNLSQLMRVVSMVLGWAVPLAWLKVTLWLLFTTNSVSNIGLLGTTVSLTPGWWLVFVSIALGILSAWASWGLWPGKRE
jgi:hypothetical protein